MNLKIKFFFFFFFISKFCLANEYLSNSLKNVLVNTYNHSPKLMVEREKLLEKDELLPQAFSEFRPSVNGYYEKGKVDTAISGSNFIADGVRTETNSGIKITQPIFNGGSSFYKVSAAKLTINSQRFKLKQVEQDVLIEVIKVYSSLASKKQEIILNKKNFEFLKKQLELSENQFDIGEITLTDVSISQARLLLSESDLIKSKSDLEAIEAKYYALIGIEPVETKLFFNFPDFKKEIGDLLNYSTQHNPSIKSIDFEIKSLNKSLKSLYSSKLPSLKLEAEARKNKGYFRSDSEREVMSAYAQLSIPLYQAGVASSKIRELKKKIASKSQYKQSKIDELKYNLVDAWSKYVSSKSKIIAYQKQIQANEKFLEGMNQELFLGERTILDVLDAEQELLESKFNLIQSSQENFNSYFNILYYMGNLNSIYLKLPVEFFDDSKNYNDVKYKWLDIIE